MLKSGGCQHHSTSKSIVWEGSFPVVSKQTSATAGSFCSFVFWKEICKMCAPLHRSKVQSLAKTKAILSSTFWQVFVNICKRRHLGSSKDLQSDQDRPGGSRRACISVLWSLWRRPPRRQPWRPRRRRSPRRSWKRLRFFFSELERMLLYF